MVGGPLVERERGVSTFDKSEHLEITTYLIGTYIAFFSHLEVAYSKYSWVGIEEEKDEYK